jgi:hypothetical protein
VPAPAPKKVDDNPFDIERAKQGLGKFPPQSQLFLDTARRDGHMSNVALATLIDPNGYTLDSVQSLWNSGDISDKSSYVVLTHGLLPPRDVLRYQYSAELLNTAIPDLKRGSVESEVVQYIDLGASFTVNVPQGFRCSVFVSGLSVVEGRQLPDSIAEARAALTLGIQRHSIGASKSDGSEDHTYSFMQRLAVWGGDFSAMAAGTVRFIARAEFIRA